MCKLHTSNMVHATMYKYSKCHGVQITYEQQGQWWLIVSMIVSTCQRQWFPA